MKNAALILSALILALSAGADTLYKVESQNGAPRITENGKPVRGRVFWGSTGGMTPEKIAAGWSDVEFGYTPEKDESARLILNIGQAPGRTCISRLEVLEAATGKAIFASNFDPKNSKAHKIRFWCNGVAENPPVAESVENWKGENAYCVRILDRNSKVLGFHLYCDGGVKLEKGKAYKVRARFWADPQRCVSVSLVENKTNAKLATNGKKTFIPQVVCAKNAGVDYVSFIIGAVWTKDGAKPDYSHIDKTFKEILAANPKAKLWPRVVADPPMWWRKANPEHVMQSSDGARNFAFASVSSEKYRRDACEALRLFIEYCEKNYPDNMSGYMPTGANTGEWFYGDSYRDPLYGYDGNSIKAWRAWLEKKYRTDAALREAWKNGEVSLKTAMPPTPAERGANGRPKSLADVVYANYLVNPAALQNVADFHLFLQDEMVSLLAGFGDVIRAAAPRRLSIIFYGYVFEFGGTVKNSPAATGHYGLSKLLKLDQIDIVCAPISYDDRKFGDAKSVMSAAESVALAGKLWLDEDDTSTYLDIKIPGRCPATDLLCDTREKTIMTLRRNMAQEAVRNQASWWMDLFGDGWFNDPKLWEEMTRFDRAERDMLANPSGYAPEVAAIIDERSICHIHGDGMSFISLNKLVRGARRNLNRCGTPFGQYLLDDILDGKVSPKLNLFLAAFALDAKQREKMAAVAEKSACVFALSTGLVDIDKRKFSTDAVKEATGFDVKILAGVRALAIPTKEGRAANITKPFGSGKYFNPLLSPIPQKGDVVLARYESGDPAVLLRQSGNFPQMFVGAPEIPTELYKFMISLSGAHVYTNDPASIYANGKYISVAALEDGDVHLNIPSDQDVFDALTNKKLGTAPHLTLPLPKGTALLLRVGKE